jgi:hypothetical protein
MATSGNRRKAPSLGALPGCNMPASGAGAPDPAEFCARLREHLAAELDKPYPESTSGPVTNFQALSEKLVQMAVGGSKDAIHIVLDRLAGRTPQAASTSDDGPLHIEYVIGIPRPDHDATEDSTTGSDLRRERPISPAG